MKNLSEGALKLERAIQEKAFDYISNSGDYRRGEELLDAAKLANKLASILDSIGNSTIESGLSVISTDYSNKTPDRPKTAAHPKFIAEGNALVKIGKGRTKKSREYKHTVPEGHLDQILSVLSAMTAQDEKFTLPALIKQVGNGCPVYQVYVTVEALRHLGFLHQITRGLYSSRNGYSIPASSAHLLATLQGQEINARVKD